MGWTEIHHTDEHGNVVLIEIIGDHPDFQKSTPARGYWQSDAEDASRNLESTVEDENGL